MRTLDKWFLLARMEKTKQLKNKNRQCCVLRRKRLTFQLLTRQSCNENNLQFHTSAAKMTVGYYSLFIIPKMHLCSQPSDTKTIKSWAQTVFKLYKKAKLENNTIGRGELLMSAVKTEHWVDSE